MAGFFERTIDALVAQGKDAKARGQSPAANLGRSARSCASSTKTASSCGRSKVTPAHIAEVVRLTQAQTISSTGAKQAVAEKALETGEPIEAIVEREGLAQVSDSGALGPVIDEVIAAHPAQAAELKAGKEKLIGFFVGQVMKQTGGKANPALLQEMIRKRIAQCWSPIVGDA